MSGLFFLVNLESVVAAFPLRVLSSVSRERLSVIVETRQANSWTASGAYSWMLVEVGTSTVLSHRTVATIACKGSCDVPILILILIHLGLFLG